MLLQYFWRLHILHYLIQYFQDIMSSFMKYTDDFFFRKLTPQQWNWYVLVLISSIREICLKAGCPRIETIFRNMVHIHVIPKRMIECPDIWHQPIRGQLLIIYISEILDCTTDLCTSILWPLTYQKNHSFNPPRARRV